MTDDFVRKAFADADKIIVEKEFDAYKRHIAEDESSAAHVVASLRVGLSKMNNLCEVVLKAGEGDVLVEYAESLLLVGFHLGYRAALEDEK